MTFSPRIFRAGTEAYFAVCSRGASQAVLWRWFDRFDARRSEAAVLELKMSASFMMRESLPGPRFNERLRVQALSPSRNG